MASDFFFDGEALRLLIRAGWFEGRNVWDSLTLPSDVQYPPEAISILSSFGNLYVHSSGAGVTLARLSINFDPSWAEKESSEDGILWDYANRMNLQLYPLGYIPDESLILCSDPAGNMYMAGDYLYVVGQSFAEGVSNILLGIKGEQLA